MPKEMTDIHVDSVYLPSNRAAAGFSLNGARYHLWFNLATLKTEDDVLYKNPPIGIKSHDPGYFYTRRLDATNRVNASLVAKLFVEIKERKLVEAAIQAALDKEAEYQREMAEKEREWAKKEAGPDLYAALVGLLEARDDGYLPPENDSRMIAARAAVAKVEGKDGV